MSGGDNDVFSHAVQKSLENCPDINLKKLQLDALQSVMSGKDTLFAANIFWGIPYFSITSFSC